MTLFLVTGGCGFIGSHLCQALRARGDEVRVLDDLSTGSEANLAPGAVLLRGDVTDPAALRRAMDGVAGCFHLAAIASVQRAADNLDTVVSEAKPGLNNFTKSTLPEANRLVHDLRDLSSSMQGFSDRLNQGGVGSVLGAPKLPDYKPGKQR